MGDALASGAALNGAGLSGAAGAFSPDQGPGQGALGQGPYGQGVPGPVTVAFVTVSGLTASSATIAWTTTLPATGQVEYGTDPAATARSPVSTSLLTDHRIVLTGLRPNATYHFTVRSVSPSGGLGISPDAAFTTALPGIGPDLSGLEARRVTATTALVGWTTLTGTVAQVEYGLDANYGSFTLLTAFAQPTQQMLLADLAPATTYHVRVKSWDAAGHLATSDDLPLVTAALGPATLAGGTVVQAWPAVMQAGQAAAYPFTATGSGQADVLRIFVDAGTTAPAFRVGVYADRDGAPDGLLSQGSAPGLGAGWKAVSLPPVSLVGGQRYWIVALAPVDSGTLVLRDGGPASSGWVNVLSKSTMLAALPATFTSGPLAARGTLAVSLEQLAPTVTLTSPSDPTGLGTFLGSGRITLSAIVDDDVPISRVQFYVDGVPLGAPRTLGPFTQVWDTAASSGLLPHTVTVTAVDALGRVGTSAVMFVWVSPLPAFP